MIDLAAATQSAVFAALNVSSVTSIASLYQHVPEDTPPPLVVIDDISMTPIGGKDGGLDRATVTIITEVRKPKRTALFALQSAVRGAVEYVPLSATGALFSLPEQTAQDAKLLDDGQTYQGTQTFEIFVQPAD